MNKLMFAAAFMAVWGAGRADILRVGADKEYKKPSEAFDAAKDGDTIVIDEGVWTDDVKYLPSTPNLTICGAGIDRTVIDGSRFIASTYPSDEPHIAGWKGLWVITGTGCTVEGVTFRNARVPAAAGQNGAGIRYEGDGPITIRNCSFTDNQNGILCGPLPNATMLIEGCVFRSNGNRAEWGGDEGNTHNLYIGAIRELIFRNCISDHAWKGHDLKSRAYKTTIENSVFDDGHDARSSYIINCPNGGDVTVTGCTLVQSETAENGVMIAVGEEGAYSGSKFREENNTFIDYRGGTPIRLVGVMEGVDIPALEWTCGDYDPASWKPSAANGIRGAQETGGGMSFYTAGGTLANSTASLTDGYIPPEKNTTDVVGVGSYSHARFPLAGESVKSITLWSLWDSGLHDGMYIKSVEIQIGGHWFCIAGWDSNGNLTPTPTGDCGRNGYDDQCGWTSAVKLGGDNSSGHLFLRLAAKDGGVIAENVTGVHIEFRVMDGPDNDRGTGIAEIEVECARGGSEGADGSDIPVECPTESLSDSDKCRLRELLGDRLSGVKSLTVSGPSGEVSVLAALGVAPSCIVEADGSAQAAYAAPSLVITGFDPGSGVIGFRIVPGAGDSIAAAAEAGCIHVFGSKDLSGEMGYMENAVVTAGEPRRGASAADLTATIPACGERFFAIRAETVKRSSGEKVAFATSAR